jgi:hypothetical protein
MYGELRMYELDYAPERLDWNEYFVRYKESGEIKFFKEFLHFYEPFLDRKSKQFIKRYELEDYRAEDLKQIFVTVLWEELQTYDSEIPLLQLTKFAVLSAWHDYVRINCGNFKLDNRHQYMLLKKIAYLYYRKKENDKPLSQIISEIAEVMDLTEDSIENYLVAVTTFKPKYNADFYGGDEDEDYYSSAVDSTENNLDTERVYFKLIHQEELLNALSQLNKKDILLIEYVYGICPQCLKNKERKSIRQASLLLGLTEDGAQKKLKSILNKLRKQLQE